MSAHPYDRYLPGTREEPGSEPPAAQPIEMFLVQPAVVDDDGCLDRVSDLVDRLDGLVLMATGGGGLIVGLPAGRKDLLAASSAVGFVGGVSFAEDAPGLAALQHRFAVNAARQLAAQGRTWVGQQHRPGDRPATPAWGQRLVDPRSLLAPHRGAASAPPPTAQPPTAQQGDHR